MALAGSDLEHLALLLRLAAMTGREIASMRALDRDEIIELADMAEEVGRQLDVIAQRQKPDAVLPNHFVQVSFSRKH